MVALLRPAESPIPYVTASSEVHRLFRTALASGLSIQAPHTLRNI